MRLAALVIVSFYCFFSPSRGHTNSQTPAPGPVFDAASTLSDQSSPQASARACSFEWISASKNSKVWTEVSEAFATELSPDTVSGNPNQEDNGYAYPVKRIVRMGRCEDAIAVILEKRANKKDEDWNRLFEIYWYSLRNKTKSTIEAKWPFWLWKYSRLAHFDESAVPDIVFQASSCTECEPEIILSTLRLNPAAGRWELRPWLDGDLGILLKVTEMYMDVDGYQTLWGIADFDGIGRDEVAVWTHYRESKEGDPSELVPVTLLEIYQYQNGVAVKREVKDAAEIDRVKKHLCRMNPKEEACRSVKPIAPNS